MTSWPVRVRNEKGVALPLALFVLVSLSAFVLAFLSMGGMEPQVARNLSDTARARYVADAAIEWAFDQLANPATNWSTVLGTNKVAGSNPQAAWLTGANGVAMTLPGLAATFGTYTVQIRNDSLATDPALTGVNNTIAPADLGVTNADNNGVLIVTATGTYNGVNRQIQVVMSRTTLPPLPGAWNCPGAQCDVNTGATAHLHTNGVDYNRDGSLGSGPLKFGMTVADGINPSTGTTFEKYVEASLTRHQMNEMTGRDQTKPCCVEIQRGSDLNCPCEGENTIVSQAALPANEQLTSAKIDKFIQQVKDGGVNVVQALTGSGGMVLKDGKPIGVNSKLPIDLGTVAKPTITYIYGNPDKANPDRTLKLTGNTAGAGILIVQDGNVEISDTFRWDGVVLVTGKNVGVSMKKFSRFFMYGGMVVNEEDAKEPAPSYEMLIEDNVHGDSSKDQFTTFYSSQQNLDMVTNMMGSIRGLTKVTTWREL